MLKDLEEKLKALKQEQEKINCQYKQNIDNLMKEIEVEKKNEQIKQAMANQFVKIPMTVFCQIINALESGMASDELIKQLIELGKQNSINENIEEIPVKKYDKLNIDFASDKDNKGQDSINFEDFIKGIIKEMYSFI